METLSLIAGIHGGFVHAIRQNNTISTFILLWPYRTPQLSPLWQQNVSSSVFTKELSTKTPTPIRSSFLGVFF